MAVAPGRDCSRCATGRSRDLKVVARPSQPERHLADAFFWNDSQKAFLRDGVYEDADCAVGALMSDAKAHNNS
ncbi:DUF2789 family protein [Pseudomonas sp. PWP3-1b2]|uniref:DUF2789 family protein n=1 Tax=Pseudomonas sp. PWP3-1b2 TaxID=2804656 RepID=UPI003CF7D7AC